MDHAKLQSWRPTLFAPAVSSRVAGEILGLDEEETRHVRALRLAPGAPVRLTDGAGSLWDAQLRAARGRSVECVLERPAHPAPRLPVNLAFGVGNKGHLMWLVEKATEMGVSRLQPLESERTRSVADAGRSPAFWNKAERRAVAAMKQSGGAWLPTIEAPLPVDDYVTRTEGEGTGGGSAAVTLRVRLDGAGPGLLRVIEAWGSGGQLAMVVGPEGGWSEGEIARFDEAGFRPAALGPLVLRFETAAIAGLAVVAQQVMLRGGARQDPSSRDAGG
jgi:16S rRNA (uracil1498-N3)-methyltransferase